MRDKVNSSYLVIHDGIGQLLDKPGQDFDIIDVAQESDERILVSEWFEFLDDPLELPEADKKTAIYLYRYNDEPLKF